MKLKVGLSIKASDLNNWLMLNNHERFEEIAFEKLEFNDYDEMIFNYYIQ
jgi:hypothetical protein